MIKITAPIGKEYAFYSILPNPIFKDKFFIKLHYSAIKEVDGIKTTLFTSGLYQPVDLTTLVEARKLLKSSDLTDFIATYKPDLLVYIMSKAIKYDTTITPNRVPFDEWKEGYEFLTVDDNSNFCGNHKVNGVEGVAMNYGENKYCKDISSFDLNSFIHLFHKGSRVKPNELAEAIGLKATLNEIKAYIGSINHSDIDTAFLPYEIRIEGDDDMSYIKCFETFDQMMDEVYRLRRCQPISLSLDVEGCGYYFNN